MMKAKKILRSTKYLISNSTVDGAKFICATTDSFGSNLWLIIVVVSSIGCLALCSKGFMDYMSYAVITDVQLDVPISKSRFLREIDVPSLIFCNQKTIKNSLFHYDTAARGIFLSLNKYEAQKNKMNFSQWLEKNLHLIVSPVENLSFEESATPEGFAQYRPRVKITQFNKYCAIPEHDADRTISIDLQAATNKSTMYMAFTDALAQIYTSRKDMLVECSWKGFSFPCNRRSAPVMFNDVLTDDVMCFHFTYDPKFIQNISEDLKYTSRSLSKAADLSVAIDIKQNQRCGIMNPSLGEGFYIASGDRRRHVVTNMLQSNFRVHPGYEYKIKVKSVLTMRHTENLRRCTSKKYLSTDGKSPPLEYAREICEAFSLIRSLIRSCQCIPPVPHFLYPYINQKNLDLKFISYKLCTADFDRFSCLTTHIMNAVTTTLASEDGNCNYACTELKFTNVIESQNLLTRIRVNTLNMTPFDDGWKNRNKTVDKWIHKNVIILNFNFERQKLQEIIEIQRFTYSDLLLYIASACGLFFGMSVMSFFEIIYFILSSFFIRIQLWLIQFFN